jgi:peptide/nickel transport system substrate-binding protein
MPVVSEDGRTYTFELRSGIRYSSGGLVKASDVRSSLERGFTLRPHPSEAISQLFGGIEGARACTPRRCDLSRGVVTDDSARTVTFHLSAPDPIFLHKLSLPFGSVLPSSASHREAQQRPVPATGPYRIASVVPGRTVRLVRNPRFHEWSNAAQPAGFPDEIVVGFVGSQNRRVDAVAEQKADVTSLDPFDLFPTPTRLRPQLRRYPLPTTLYFVLDPTRPPFDDVRARRALNYAVDRDKIIQLAGEDAAPTCQVLPPNFPGYRRYCPYTLDPNREGTWTAPDLTKALRLVSESGTQGEPVTIWFSPKVNRVGGYIASVLESLGYRVRVHPAFEDEDVYFKAMAPASPQIAWSGWFADYPAADNFIQPLFECGSETNFGSFCDRAIDRKIEHALEVQGRDPAAANRLWANLDHELTDRAAWLPLYNVYGADLVSKRVGNYQHNPQYGALLSQMWVR